MRHQIQDDYSFAVSSSNICTEDLVLLNIFHVKYFKHINALWKLFMIARMFMPTLFSTKEKVKNWNIFSLMEIFNGNVWLIKL